MSKPTLKFRADRTFTIAQLTDLHIQDRNEEGTVQTLELVERILDAEKPDLVVMTGDVLAGRGCDDPVASYGRIARVMEDRGIPWAAVFGNHDDEGIHSRAELMAAQQQFPHCLSEPGPDDLPGVGNYVLKVQSSSGDGDGAVLYMIDSLSYGPEGVGGYAWVEHEQITWYRNTAMSMGQHLPSRLPALAFFHIPVPEYDWAWEHGVTQGDKYENVCAPKLNSGLFLSFIEMGDVLGTFVGHDHVNDYDAEAYGIRLCYGRAGGFGTYGREGFPRGARLIRLLEGEPAFETWIRLDGGDVIDRGKGPLRDEPATEEN